MGGGDDRWPLVLGTNIVTTIAYGSALLAVGGWWFARLLARHRLGSVADESWRRFVTQCAAIGGIAVVAALPGRLARLGGAEALEDASFAGDALRGPLGASVVVVCAGLGVVVLAARRRSRSDALAVDVVGAAGGLLALSGFALEGHTRSMRPIWAMIGFDVVHLSAAALWIGGLAGLVVSFRTRPAAHELATVVRRFSAAAVVSVVAVSAAGVGMSLIVLDSLSALTSTGYGLALMTKVALVAVVVAMGGYNRTRLVPAMSAGAAVAPAWTQRRLVKVLWAELAVLVAVAGATAVLVTRSPVEATEPTPRAEPVQVVVPLSRGAGQVTMRIDPAVAGANSLSIRLADAEGDRLRPIEPPTVDLTEPEHGVGPIRVETQRLRRVYAGTADLAVAGDWDVLVRVRIDEFESVTGTATVEIADVG